MKETKDKGVKVNLVAIVLAFVMGLTLGQVDFNKLMNRDSELKSRESTTVMSTESTTASTVIYTSAESVTESTTVVYTSAVANKIIEEGEMVYRTPTGKRYHYNPDCAGVNRIESTVDESTSLGLTPCKKCAGG